MITPTPPKKWAARGAKAVRGPILFTLVLACGVFTIARASQDKPKTPVPAANPKWAEDSPTRKLFIANCVQCHGVNGDAQGATTKLDRPARSFQSGGFSYGNTPEMLFRSITNGIPGTPMPSFAKALNDQQRKDLAAYVLLFAPQDTINVTAKETEMVVKDKPLIAYGKLPPIVDGAKETVRGLLIGTPDGLTFEYDRADVRLLGVRQGGFCERKDWSDRGGAALQPLGTIVHVLDKDPIGMFWMVGADKVKHKLSASLVTASVGSGRASLTYDVCDDSKGTSRAALVRVSETPTLFTTNLGSGFTRLLTLTALLDFDQLQVLLDIKDSATGYTLQQGSRPIAWHAEPLADGTWDVIIGRSPGGPGFVTGSSGNNIACFISLKRDASEHLEIFYLPHVKLDQDENKRTEQLHGVLNQ